MQSNRSQIVRVSKEMEGGLSVYSQINNGVLTSEEAKDAHFKTEKQARRTLAFQKTTLDFFERSYNATAAALSIEAIVSLFREVTERGDQYTNEIAFYGSLGLLFINLLILRPTIEDRKRAENRLSAVKEANAQDLPNFSHIYPL